MRPLILPTLLLLFTPHTFVKSLTQTYNVVTLGANPDGVTDSSTAFLDGWAAACGSTGRPTIYVPPGRFFFQKPISFLGRKCRNKGVNFLIEGTLLAPTDFLVLGNFSLPNWIKFESVTGVTISGGTLDGQGAALWACKMSTPTQCPVGLSSIAFAQSMNIVIKGLTSLNSQFYHIVVYGCNNVKIQGVRVSAPSTSPNTDGIHISFSTGVSILSTSIGTGDDCISIGPGTTNMYMGKIKCGPGHGISIGSLGNSPNEAGVENITVNIATFTATENGVRIKTWGRPGNGFVREVMFQNITMLNAQNPIIIDQNYCPHNSCISGQASGISISNITYKDIKGTSGTPVAIKFDCSSENHCTDVRLENVTISYMKKAANSSCSNVGGSTNGLALPNCF